MNTYEKVFSDSGNKKVVLINDNSDPSMWMDGIVIKFVKGIL